MKYKIAIMTQPLGSNYGGIIQNYALQKVFTDMGHETVTIDRRGENTQSKIRILAGSYKMLFFRHVLKSKNPAYLDFKKIFASNHSFLKKYINLSPQIQSTQALEAFFSKEKFDAIVVGSDQVWRPRYSPNIFNFYLDFISKRDDIKKVAYAASFGTEEWEYTKEQTEKCRNLIQQFHGISVREDSGIQLCTDYLRRNDAEHVLDPTLLLKAEDYSKFITESGNKKGLFSYVLDNSKEKKEFIDICAEELKLEKFSNQSKYKTNVPKNGPIDDYIVPPIEGWLQGFRDADFVITDSFHGTVFSILNEKPFFTLVNKSRGASRFESLLQQLGLADRLIYDVKDFDVSQLSSQINYEPVRSKLHSLKENSINFLKSNL